MPPAGGVVLRVHRRSVLQARLHGAEGDGQQDDAARRHLRVRRGLPSTVYLAGIVSHPADSLVSLMGKLVNLGDRERDGHRCACEEGIGRARADA